jgi:Ca-activated chloride channel family protein
MNPAVLRTSCRRFFPLFLLALLGVSVSTPAAAQAVERDLFVTVVDRADKPVPNLGPKDFVVKEDGRTREVLKVRPASEPIDLAILVDTSAAANSQISDMRKGLEALIARMRPAGHIALVEFGERPRVLTDYTNDAVALTKGLGRVFATPGSGAYTLDALLDTVKGLKKRDGERAAIVVLWVGGTEFSSRDARQVVAEIAGQGAALHVLTVTRGTPADALTVDGRSRDEVFDSGARTTGGSNQNLLSSMAIAEALDRLATQMLSQYRVTYARPKTLIPPEKVEVSAASAEFKARGTAARVPAGPAR